MQTDNELFRRLLDILDTRPEAREALRQRLLPSDGTEQVLRELVQAQARTEQHLASLTQRVDQLAERMDRLADAQQRTEARLEELARAQVATEARLEELARAQVATEARLEELARAQAATEARLEELARAQAATEARLGELAQAQQRTEARLGELAQAQQRTEARLGELARAQVATEARLGELARAQSSTEATLDQVGRSLRELATSVAGEREQRRGEAYERDFRRNAVLHLQSGEGGAPLEPRVESRIAAMLQDVLASGTQVTEEANPLNADLIWWKGGHLAVVEVSLVVGMHDVDRAVRRAATIRAAGRQHGVESVLPVVAGRRWSGRDAHQQAEHEGVAWWIQDPEDISSAMSPSFVAYRRRRPSGDGEAALPGR